MKVQIVFNQIKLFKIENIGEPIYCDVNIKVFFNFYDELRTIILWCDGNMIIGSPVTIQMLCPKGITGIYTLTAIADAWEVINELEEDNNEMSISVKDKPRILQYNTFFQNLLNRLSSNQLLLRIIL